MYSYHNNLLPHMFNTTFVTNRQVHTYDTRNANNYRPYFCRTNIKRFTILYDLNYGTPFPVILQN